VRQKKIYVAGPMRNILEFNFPAFDAATAKLIAQGYIVFNPAENDRLREGRDISKEVQSGDLAEAEAKGFSLRVALGEDLAWICQHADSVALLPGWRNSKGATAEHATALALGLEVIEL